MYLYLVSLLVTECAAQVYKSHPIATAAAAAVKPTVVNDDFITQTVYGFLDFTTTIGNTVMVFSPQSAPSGIISYLKENPCFLRSLFQFNERQSYNVIEKHILIL